jgi:hypothetical protein
MLLFNQSVLDGYSRGVSWRLLFIEAVAIEVVEAVGRVFFFWTGGFAGFAGFGGAARPGQIVSSSSFMFKFGGGG